MTRIADVVDMTFGYAFKSADFSDVFDDVRLLRGDNIAQGRLRWNGVKRFPAARVDEVERYQLAVGDVVVAMDRPWIEAGLKYSVVREDDVPSLLVQRVARLRSKSDSLDQGFLGLIIGSAAFTNYVIAVQTGSAVPHISGRQIGDFEFGLPPIEVQHAISATLGALDDKIDSNRRKKELAWGLVAAEWERLSSDGEPATIGDLLSLAYGKALPAKNRIAGDVPVYGSSGATGKHNEALVNGPAVIVGRKGTVGVVHWSHVNAFPIDTTFYAKPKDGWPLLACFFALRSAGLTELNSDSAVPGLNRDRAQAAEILVPESWNAMEWSARHAPTLNLIRLLETENRELVALRDTLLPELLSGRMRISTEGVKA